MNPSWIPIAEARVALRPRSMSDVLDLAGPFCITNRRLMAPLALWVTLLGGALAALCRLVLDWPWGEVWLLIAGYLLLSGGVFTQAAGELLFRAPADVRVLAVLARFMRRFAPFFAARLVHLIVLGACAMVVAPLPVFAARLAFVGEAVLLESGSAMGSFARSSRLVLYRGVPCMGLVLACACAPFVFAMAADLIGNAIVDLLLQMGRPVGSLWSDGGSAYAVVGALLSAPFVASASFLAYIDLRTRKEGWDIQLRFMAVVDAEEQGRSMAS
jgi:hypothetical protein